MNKNSQRWFWVESIKIIILKLATTSTAFQQIYFQLQKIIFLPTVIREGKPWGLKMMSGVIPLSVNGMSSDGQRMLEGKKIKISANILNQNC